ncbi:transposase [Vacuolonema iberomarrocanum]|uniref:transposase n=1 Tax=Vacuolonema iberomarrocanum TaxID=3454632 RepID=UPI001A085476|nr:transposase [filamentous cyanobacterium LEGE 07170]
MSDHLETLRQFRQAIYESFPYRRDSLLDLLDAFSSNERARSTVELSLNSCFRRQYSALYKALGQAYVESDYPVCSLEAYQQGAALLDTLPPPTQQPYRVFGLDETPNERLYARCLSDRQTIHRSTPVAAQRPVSEGHNYSVLAAFPEVEAADWSQWAVPLNVARVSSLSNAIEVAHHQIAQLLSYPQTANDRLKVLSVDSRYPTPAFLHGLRDYPDLLVIARVRRNRSFYAQPVPDSSPTRPRWYGRRFKLNDDATWPPPTQQQTLNGTQRNGQTLTYRLSRWTNLLMRGTRDYPMHRYPFDVLCCQRLNANSQPQGAPLWLLIWGQSRQHLSSVQGQHAYAQRFRLEHFFGFAKPHLLLTAFQTCHTSHEINAVRLAALAYGQLWLARHLVKAFPLPWQRYLPTANPQQHTPRQLQRGFAAFIHQMGSVATPPKTRGISPGRPKGTRLRPRSPCPLVKFHPSQKLCPCKDSQKSA